MLERKTLYAGLISLGLLFGCSNPHLEYESWETQPEKDKIEKKETEIKDTTKEEKKEESLEGKLENELYIKINKNTSEDIPKLYLKNANTQEVYMQMPVAIGAGKEVYDGEWRNWETPAGEYEIAGVFYKPIWYPTDDNRGGPVKPGADNPLGNWMFILLDGNHTYNKDNIHSWSDADWRLLRIHSTNEPESIGKEVSRGCVRMHPDNARELAEYLLTESDYVSKEVKKGNPSYSDSPAFKSTFRGDYKPFKAPLDVYIKN